MVVVVRCTSKPILVNIDQAISRNSSCSNYLQCLGGFKYSSSPSASSYKVLRTQLLSPTTKTELLFVERIFNMLKMGGTAAIIVPQGVLFGSGKAFTTLRKKIIEEAELKAVIALPSGVFKPYSCPTGR